MTWSKKQDGAKALDDGCNAIKHYARQLVEVTCEKIEVEDYMCKCDKVIHETKVCDAYKGCYAASVKAYDNNKIEIEKKNEAAKLEWRAVGRVECLVKVMGAGEKADEKQLTACVKGPAISTKPLDLIYPEAPPEEECALKGVDEAQRKRCEKGDPGKKKPAEKKVVKR